MGAAEARRWARLAATLAAVLAALFLLVAALALSGPGPGAGIDGRWGRWAVAASDAHGWLLEPSRALDVVGGGRALTLVVTVVTVALVLARRPAPAAYLVLSALGGSLLVTAVKAAVERPRPPWNGLLLYEATSSFPSGHAAAGISTVVALGVVALVVLPAGWRGAVAVPLFVLGPVIGVSRTMLGVHWASDVVAGWLLGGAWTCAVGAAVLAVSSRRTSRAVPASAPGGAPPPGQPDAGESSASTVVNP